MISSMNVPDSTNASGKILMFSHMLDTNIVIYVIKRRPLEVLEVFNRYAGKMVISSITYGGWFTGWRTALAQR